MSKFWPWSVQNSFIFKINLRDIWGFFEISRKNCVIFRKCFENFWKDIYLRRFYAIFKERPVTVRSTVCYLGERVPLYDTSLWRPHLTSSGARVITSIHIQLFNQLLSAVYKVDALSLIHPRWFANPNLAIWNETTE